MKKIQKLTFFTIFVGSLIRILFSQLATPTGDSVWHVNAAIFMSKNLKIPLFESIGRLDAFWAPPLMHFFGAFFYGFGNLFGSGIFFLKLVPALFGIGTLITFYFFSKDLFGEKKAFFATFFLTFLPIHMYYSSIWHIDVAATFFSVLCVYIAYKKRTILTAIFLGLGMLTKYNILFIVPVVIYLLLKDVNKKEWIKSFSQLSIISFLISLAWYLRNLFLLQNPIYHFLPGLWIKFGLNPYSSIGSSETLKYGFSELFKFKWYFNAYLDLFGVPLGKINNLMLLKKLPLYPLTLISWFAGTFIYFLPLIKGFFIKKKYALMLWIWIVPHIFQMWLFMYENGADGTAFRYFLPAIPAFALIWAEGLNSFKKFIPVFLMILVVISSGFIISEFGKTYLSTSRIDRYDDVWDFVKYNTSEDSLVFPPSFTYYTQRKSIPLNQSFDYAYFIEIPELLDKHSGFSAEERSNFTLVYNGSGRVYEVSSQINLYNKRAKSNVTILIG